MHHKLHSSVISYGLKECMDTILGKIPSNTQEFRWKGGLLKLQFEDFEFTFL